MKRICLRADGPITRNLASSDEVEPDESFAFLREQFMDIKGNCAAAVRDLVKLLNMCYENDADKIFSNRQERNLHELRLLFFGLC